MVAFAATTAVALVVTGGLLAFLHRAESSMMVGSTSGWVYVMLAGLATALLLVPLATLGAAAARLAMARRDARLAALRLAGATTVQVSGITLLDAGLQALLGALLGVGGYLAAIPLVAVLRFQDRPFAYSELWVGLPVLSLTAVAVVVIAVLSAAVSLRRVRISPLGVAARVPGASPRLIRVLALVVVVVAVAVASRIDGSIMVIAVVIGLLALGMATLNLIGPAILAFIGRRVVAAAKTGATLLAGRRLSDDPRAAWRNVGGIGLAAFIAGVTSIIGVLSSAGAADPDQRVFAADVTTGGLLTLVIAGILAAVSTGVAQATRIVDQRQESRNLILAGTELKVLDQIRFREIVIPLGAALATATFAMLALMAPLVGFAVFANPQVMGLFLASVVAASGLVLLGSWSSRFVARRLLVDLSS